MDTVITVGINAVFFIIIIWVLHLSFQRERSFSDYAVGGRSFGGAYIAMSYANSWFPGTIFISFLGLGVATGVLGLYLLTYSLLGVTAMYLMARRAWNWGQAFNLRTQPDMMRLRYGSVPVRVIASAIGVISLFPWIILSMQSLGVIFQYMSLKELSSTAALMIGALVIIIRQYWTVRMGMRGLVITDMVQGFFAYIVASLVMAIMIFASFNGFAAYHDLAPEMWKFPNGGGAPGPFYFGAITVTGIIGSLCWPTSYQRIYTADSVRSVKKGTLLAMPLIWVFSGLLLLISFSMAGDSNLVKSPQTAFFDGLWEKGGPWLLGLACLIVFAAAMGWIDGCIQVCGTQVSNDIVGSFKLLPDHTYTILAKSFMIVFIIAGAIAAYLTYDYGNLVNLAIMAYQGIVQLAVPMFLGLFWKRGTKQGAIWGMTVGFVVAVVLTFFYPDDIPWLGGVTAGIPALVLNLLIYVGFALLRPQDEHERARVNALFERGRHSWRTTTEEMLAAPGVQNTSSRTEGSTRG